MCLFCSPPYLQCLEQCLTHGPCLVNIFVKWMSKDLSSRLITTIYCVQNIVFTLHVLASDHISPSLLPLPVSGQRAPSSLESVPAPSQPPSWPLPLHSPFDAHITPLCKILQRFWDYTPNRHSGVFHPVGHIWLGDCEIDQHFSIEKNRSESVHIVLT